MIRQESTYYKGFTIKTFSEFSGDILIKFTEYNKKGKPIFEKQTDGLTRTSKYRGDKLVSRYYSNGQWEKYSYSKVKKTRTLMINRPEEKYIWVGVYDAETNECIDSKLLNKKTKK